jgi:arylsulfatase A-like enzyme
MRRMSVEQLQAWRDAYRPKDEAFHRSNPIADDLVRWKYQRYAKNYLRCVKGVDESVGRLMETLSALNLDDNTIVIYSSDQGFYIGDHGWFDKRWMYEESLKMPFVIKWPGAVQPGSRDKTNMIQNLDYAETFLEIAGAEIPADMQGRSLVPLLKGEQPKDWRKSIYYHYYEYPSVHMVPRHYGVRTETHKLMRFYQFDEWEFYDLQADPDELKNEYNNPAYADEIAELKTELERLRDHYDDDSDVSVESDEWQHEMRTVSITQ